MEIKHEFKLLVSDFRKATYYGMFQRNPMMFRIIFLLVLAYAGYLIAVIASLLPANLLLLSAGILLAVYILIIMAGAEAGMKRYVQSKDCVLGKTFIVHFHNDLLRIRIPELRSDEHVFIRKLAVVFELSEIYMIYINEEKTYIVPKRGLSEEQILEIRKIFLTEIPDHFFTRRSNPKRGLFR